jgi:hypothetical protein
MILVQTYINMPSSTIIRGEESSAIPLLKFIQLLPRHTSSDYRSLINMTIVVVSSAIPLLNASHAKQQHQAAY